METDVKQRLIQFLDEIGMSKTEFGRRIGASSAYVTSIRKSIPAEKLMLIKEQFPQLNIDWLITGQGNKYNDDVHPANMEEPEPFTENKNGNYYYRRSDGQLFVEVPLVPYSALGSPADEFAELTADRSRYKMMGFEVDRVGHGRYFAFEVDGDSMDDGTRSSFERGDVVLVRELDRSHWLPKLHLSQWRFWVVCWQNCVRLKEITAQTATTITLHSLNPSPEYTDFTLNLAEVSRLFNVIKKVPKSITYG